MEKVLILLSTYNGEEYLEEQLNSLIRQKDVDVHVLIRDDGSKDNTIQILKKLNYPKATIIFGENKGACNSFFELIKDAELNYDYYALCDQDDVWFENKIKIAINNLNKFPQNSPCLYYSGQVLTDKNLKVISEHHLDDKKSIQANWVFNQMAGCTAVFNSKLLEILKKYIPKNINYHDVWIYKVAACFNGNIYIDKKGYIYYRQHGKNVIGMNNGIKGKLNRAKRYIYLYNCSSFAKEILNGYENELDDFWKEFLKVILLSNNNLKARLKLLNNPAIKFNSLSLRCLFIIKVILKKI